MTPRTYNEVVKSVQSHHYRDVSDALTYLHDLDVSIVMAIRVTRAVFALTMGEAKTLVRLHSAWRDEAASGEKVQTAAESAAVEYVSNKRSPSM